MVGEGGICQGAAPSLAGEANEEEKKISLKTSTDNCSKGLPLGPLLLARLHLLKTPGPLK